VKRLLGEYGDESVLEAYLLREGRPDYWLDYLLRRHKGCYYRRRYPPVAVI
jgi:hypothetical protein